VLGIVAQLITGRYDAAAAGVGRGTVLVDADQAIRQFLGRYFLPSSPMVRVRSPSRAGASTALLSGRILILLRAT
jgi:hypothetical protein